MATNKQILLCCFLFLNVMIVMMNGIAWQKFWDRRNKKPMLALTLLEDPVHPFDQLPRRLEQLNWDPKQVDEVIRKYWKTGKTFLEYQVEKNNTGLSTSCLHTAAWIVTGLLELQTRPNYYIGVYKLPKNKDLVVYNNTQKPRSSLAAPVIQSLENFIASRPLGEPILLQIDMLQLRNKSYGAYIDHHFAIHIYKGQVSLYQGWQDFFSLIDWMREPGSFKFRYPMPVDTFLAHFETFLTHTEEDQARRKRLEETWKIFGITETFTYGKKDVLDPVVRGLRYPWIVSLITHWPNPS